MDGGVVREQDGVLIERSVNQDGLEWPSEAELAEEGSFNRTYRDLRGLSWDEASQVLIIEREIIDGCSGDLEAATESMSDREWASLGYLDLGVAAAVVALSAASCAPIYSCNGSAGHNDYYPVVAFFCRKVRVRDLLRVAELTECGLCNSHPGTLVLYAGNIQRLMNFAEALIEASDTFKSLSRPQSTRRPERPPKRDQRQLTFDL